MLTMLKTIEPFTTRFTDKARLYGIPHSDIDIVWPEVIPYLEKTLMRADGKYSIPDIYHELITREMQLWVVFDLHLICFAITKIIQFPQCKVLSIPYVGGEKMHKWIEFYENLVAFGKTAGCTKVEGYARPGWERVLTRFGNKGMKKIYTTISADI